MALKCKVEVGQMQLDRLLSKFSDSSNVKTTKKSIRTLDSIAKVRQKDSAARGAQHAAEAKAKREAKKAKEKDQG